MKWLRKVPLVLVVVAVVAWLVYGFWPQPEDVDVAAVQRGSLLVTVNEDGKTRIREKYVVSAPVSGKLLRQELRAGDLVRQGKTVLALIEPSDPSLLDARATAEAKARVRADEASQAQSQAGLSRAKESYELAKSEYERAESLIQRGAITQAEFDRHQQQERIAEADVRAAEFARKVADFELQLAQAALIRTRGSAVPGSKSTMTILAPVSGRVLRVFQESAGVVTRSTRLIEVGDPLDLEMQIDVLSTDAVRIRPGAKVLVEHWGGDQTLTGSVRVVEPAGFLKISALGVEEQRVNVIADFLDPLEKRETLGDGYRVEARIVVDEAKDTLLVPAGVLFRDGEDWCVFQVVDGRARLRRVETGRSNGRKTEIVQGLEADDVVILHPSDEVSDGVGVKAH